MPFCGASACKGRAGRIDPNTAARLEAGFNKLQAATDCKSLLKKYLTPALYEKLKGLKTKFGSSLLDVVQSGFENLDSGIGVYSPDGGKNLEFLKSQTWSTPAARRLIIPPPFVMSRGLLPLC